MGIGVQLRRIREYYTHREVNQRIRDAQTELEHTQEHVANIKETVIKPAKKHYRENNISKLLEESLRIGYGK